MLIERLTIAIASASIATASFAQAPEWIDQSDKSDDMYDVDWPGGTLGELFDGIDEIDEGSFVVPVDARDIQIEAFSVDDAWVNEIIEVAILLKPGLDVSQIGGQVAVGVGQTGEMRNIDRPWNYVVSVSNELVDRARAERSRFSISFTGGPVREYVRAVSEASGEKKFVVMPDASALPVPSVELTNVDVTSASELLHEIADVYVHIEGGIAVIRKSQSLGEAVRGMNRAAQPPKSEAWAVEGIIGAHMSSEDLLSAIDRAIELADGETRVRFHPETGMVMARGPSDELQMISHVISQARETNAVRKQRRHIDRQIHDMLSEVEQHRVELETARANLEGMEKSIEDAKRAVERGDMSAAVFQEHNQSYRNAQNSVQFAEIKLHEALDQLSALKQQREAMK